MMDFSAFDRFKARRKSSAKTNAQAIEHATFSIAQKSNHSIYSRPSKPGRVIGPKGRQQQQIDRQIWLIHQQMVDKLLANPALLPPVQLQLEQAQQQGLLRHSEYLFWHCALALYQEPDAFRAALLSLEPGPTKYRRSTRLQGVLTEAERAAWPVTPDSTTPTEPD